MACIWVESICPRHGFERFKIKIVKKYNMKPDLILPKLRTKPHAGLSSLVVGRDVSIKEAENFLNEYFRQKEPNISVIKMVIEFKV